MSPRAAGAAQPTDHLSDVELLSSSAPAKRSESPEEPGISNRKLPKKVSDLKEQRRFLLNSRNAGARIFQQAFIFMHNDYRDGKITRKIFLDKVDAGIDILNGMLISHQIDMRSSKPLDEETCNNLEKLDISNKLVGTDLKTNANEIKYLMEELMVLIKGDDGVAGEIKRAKSMMERIKYLLVGATDEPHEALEGTPDLSQAFFFAPMG